MEYNIVSPIQIKSGEKFITVYECLYISNELKKANYQYRRLLSLGFPVLLREYRYSYRNKRGYTTILARYDNKIYHRMIPIYEDILQIEQTTKKETRKKYLLDINGELINSYNELLKRANISQ
jgi:hypothetical protein